MKGKWCLAKLFMVFQTQIKNSRKLFQMFSEIWNRANPVLSEKGRGKGKEMREEEGDKKGGGVASGVYI